MPAASSWTDLLEQVAAGAVLAVIAWNLPVLARRVHDAARLLDTLERAGAQLHLAEPPATTAALSSSCSTR